MHHLIISKSCELRMRAQSRFLAVSQHSIKSAAAAGQSGFNTMSLRRSARIQTSALVEAPNAFNLSAVTSKMAPNGKKRQQLTTVKDSKRSKKVKTSAGSQEEGATIEDSFKVPSTPKRRTKNVARAPPITPTPSLVKLVAPYSSGDIDDAAPPPLNRPVEPHRTTATLVTPGGTQKTAYPQGLPDSSPSKTGLPRPTATTGTLLDQALDHLRTADKRMISLIDRHHCHIFSPEGLAEEIDPFRSLASGIMAQQVSGAAAKSIKNKFVALFHDNEAPTTTSEATSPSFPTPTQVAATDIAHLRTAGLSQRKAEYIHGLAEKFVSGDLSTSMLLTATDEEVMEKLVAVRGLGRWSVEMFACFGLKRMDVFSTGDLGVQRGMAAFVGRDVAKLKAKGSGGKWKYMSEKEMEEIAEKFRPYRSLFMWYMWRAEDIPVDLTAIAEA